MPEEWLDESIGIATGFVYYEFRVGAGKQIDPSVLSHLVMQLARHQFGINPASAKHAPVAPECCFKPLAPSLAGCCLFGRRFLKRGRYCCCRPAESFSFDSSIAGKSIVIYYMTWEALSPSPFTFTSSGLTRIGPTTQLSIPLLNAFGIAFLRML